MQHWPQALTIVVVLASLAGTQLLPASRLGRGGGEPASASVPTHGCPAAGVGPGVDPPRTERATLCLLNAERGAHHLHPLRLDSALRLAALRQSRDMVSRHFFEHVNPDGIDPTQRMARAGYRIGPRGGMTAENLAYGEESLATPAAIVDGWMHSPGHRRNILFPALRDIGIGIVPEPVKRSSAENSGATYTTDFGARR